MIPDDSSLASVDPAPRWRRGLSTLLGMPAMPIRKLLPYDLDHLASQERQRRGLTLVLSGIEGRGPFCSSLARGIGDGWPGGVELFEWTTRRMFATLKHLADLARNREQASLVADRVQQHWLEFPDSPVHLVGHSGGAAIAAFALEELQHRQSKRRVNRALLLGAALSQSYDLNTALQCVDEIHSFHSPFDIPHLVLGTAIFGTIDRKRGISAGFQGFERRSDGHYDRLFQHPYQRHMLTSWHWGGHMGWTNRVFAAEHLTSYLESPASGRQRLADVAITNDRV